MYLTSEFKFKPLNPQRILNQHKKLNSKISSSTQQARKGILDYINPDKAQILQHEVVHRGVRRRPITGITQIKESKGYSFPAGNVNYLASSPIRNPFAEQGAIDDLGDYLIERLGDDGMFDITPVNHKVKELYQTKLGVDNTGMGSVRGLRRLKKRKTINNN